MKKIVLKFGGSSLQNASLRATVIKIIKKRLLSGCFPVIVVSAMGRQGDRYSTDTLLKLLPQGSSPRHQALISACGEMISASLLAEELNYCNVPAIALTGWQAGLLTDDKFADAEVINIDVSRLNSEIEAGNIPVVCGFQGISVSAELTTLGRGGSDTTAALIARAISAEYLELFKDVDGIFTADPRLVEQARIIKILDYNEIAELTGNGAKIVHNPAIRQLADKNIPLFLGNSATGNTATCIKPYSSRKPVTAVTSRSQLSLVSIINSQYNRFSSIFTPLARQQISLDFITVNSYRVAFVIDSSCTHDAANVLNQLDMDYYIKKGFCKITITGSGMTGQPGVMSKLAVALESENIKIDMATDSYSTISCLIRADNEVKALNIIHEAFALQEE